MLVSKITDEWNRINSQTEAVLEQNFSEKESIQIYPPPYQ